MELTETRMPEDDRVCVEVLAEVAAMGVSLSLDDFGTGYSSITHLRRYPFDMLKLDRSLIVAVATDSNAAGIVEILVQLSRLLGIGLIAEGVEDDEQADALRHLGCPQAQGYLFGRPRALTTPPSPNQEPSHGAAPERRQTKEPQKGPQAQTT